VETAQVEPVAAGDVVKVVTEDYEPRFALVTVVHGTFREGQAPPCINVVYVSSDESKRDPYGQQLERMSSLQHISATTNMPRPGRYWTNA
jgi:hypothetical protein